MNSGDLVGLILVSVPGIWFIAHPRSVIHAYKRFHGPELRMPSDRVVRVVGGTWVLVSVLIVAASRR